MPAIQQLLEQNLDALLITKPENIRYLSGFTNPKDAHLVVRPDGPVLLTDGRYIAQAAQESRVPYRILDRQKGEFSLIDGRFTAQPTPSSPIHAELLEGSVGYEARHLSVEALQILQQATAAEWIATTERVERLRIKKDAQEAEAMREAAALADRAFEHILPFLKPGTREIDVALELEFFLRKNGAEAVAFKITVASGKRSAMPHGGATGKTIEAGELVTLDFGACIEGYNSDMTRTVGIGKVRPELKAIYDAVYQAQATALQAVAPNKATKELDALARGVLERLGYGQYFTHGLGHGVGLAVHEAPFASALSDDILEPGMTLTIEPGAYIPGLAGVRIEDLVLVTPSGYKLLSHSPKQWMEL